MEDPARPPVGAAAIAVGPAQELVAARLGLEQEIGSLRPGLRADLLLLDGDPLQDIRNVERIHTVIQDSRLIDRGALLRPDR